MTIIAIHQPNFFPWLGYFDKICRADLFVFLDHVQYQKSGGTWSNRVKLLVGGEGRWVSAPLDRSFSGTRRIDESRFSAHSPWRDKLLGTLQASYRGAPHYSETMEILEPLVRNPEERIAQYNITAVRRLTEALGLDGDRFRRSSQMDVEGAATELLIRIVKSLGGSAYMCGGGAEGYQEDEAFRGVGLGLIYQSFEHPRYPQTGSETFVAGLSIIDALMNLGFAGVRECLAGPARAQSR